MAKLVVNNLYKIFGPSPRRGLELLKQGQNKDEILNKTGLTVGVNNASFSVEEGEVFVIMGLSGSGKSTLVRCLNRLIEPTRGEIVLDGDNILQLNTADLREMRRKKMSMVFQNFGLLPNRTVLGNVEYGLEVQGVERQARQQMAAESLTKVGLKGYKDSYPDQLSGGMKQRVGLARALANDPEVLLMDEAFSALDPLIRGDMQDELLELQAEMQRTIVFITHDLDEALKLGDRIMLMKDGRTAQIGTAEEILTHPADDYVRRFVQGINRSDVLTAGDIMAKPLATISVNQGPRLALKEMKEHNIESVMVLDQKRRLLGAVVMEDVLKAIEQGEKTVQQIIREDINITGPDTNLSDFIQLTINSPAPLAVVDDSKRLQGVIVRGSVLEAMIPEGEAEDAD